MNFGEAIATIRDGGFAHRAAWGGAYVYQLDMFATAGTVYQACVAHCDADGRHTPGWLPSQADMLADDWTVE